MIIYKYPYGSDVGEYIVVGQYKGKTLIYSLTTSTFPRFFFIYNELVNLRYKIHEDINNKFYVDEMQTSYQSFKTIMTASIDHLDPMCEKYINIITRRNNYKQICLFEAVTQFFEKNIDVEIEKIIELFGSNSL